MNTVGTTVHSLQTLLERSETDNSGIIIIVGVNKYFIGLLPKSLQLPILIVVMEFDHWL
jgi:hypothetical protein